MDGWNSVWVEQPQPNFRRILLRGNPGPVLTHIYFLNWTIGQKGNIKKNWKIF
jgi:hypothetical protein